MIGLEIPILFLEDYASGSTGFSIVQWGNIQAKAFCYEANWYIGTSVNDDWFSIHCFCSYTIDGVVSRTNRHFDGGVAVHDRYGLNAIYFIEFNSTAEGFSEDTGRNHCSPSAVYVWCAEVVNRTIEEFVVDQVLIGTDGHNNGGASVWIFIAEGVGQSLSVHFAIVSLNSYNDVCGTFSIGFNIDLTSAVLDSLVDINVNGSFFVALAFYTGTESTVNLGKVAIFINNSYINEVAFTNRTLFGIESESFIQISADDGQSLGLIAKVLVEYLNSHFGTDEGFVSNGVVTGSEIEVAKRGVAGINSFTSYSSVIVLSRDGYMDAIYVNVFRLNRYILTQSNLIVDSLDGIIVVGVCSTWSCGEIEVDAFNFAEFSEGEAYGYSIVATIVQSNANLIFTRNEILRIVVAYILEGVSTAIPSEYEVRSFESRSSGGFSSFWFVNDSEVFSVLISIGWIFRSSIFIFQNKAAFRNLAINVSDFELNSIAEGYIAIAINASAVGSIVTSEHGAAILSNIDGSSIDIILIDDQNANNLTVFVQDVDGIYSRFSEGELNREVTISISSYSGLFQGDTVAIVIALKSQFGVFSIVGSSFPSYTLDRVLLGFARSYIVVQIEVPMITIITICISESYTVGNNSWSFYINCESLAEWSIIAKRSSSSVASAYSIFSNTHVDNVVAFCWECNVEGIVIAYRSVDAFVKAINFWIAVSCCDFRGFAIAEVGCYQFITANFGCPRINKRTSIVQNSFIGNLICAVKQNRFNNRFFVFVNRNSSYCASIVVITDKIAVARNNITQYIDGFLSDNGVAFLNSYVVVTVWNLDLRVIGDTHCLNSSTSIDSEIGCTVLSKHIVGIHSWSSSVININGYIC